MTPDSVQPNSVCKHEWARACATRSPSCRCGSTPTPSCRSGWRPASSSTSPATRAALARLRDPPALAGLARGAAAGAEGSPGRRRARAAARRETPSGARIEQDIDELRSRSPSRSGRSRTRRPPAGAPRSASQRPGAGTPAAEPVAARPQQVHQPAARLAPAWFQDRHVETEPVGDFLKDEGLRLMTVVGRGGVGKTAMVCRLLKALEGGRLPDDGRALRSTASSTSARSGLHQVSFAHLFADLCRLLPPTRRRAARAVYRTPQAPAGARCRRCWRPSRAAGRWCCWTTSRTWSTPRRCDHRPGAGRGAARRC